MNMPLRAIKVAFGLLLLGALAVFALTQYRVYHRNAWKNIALARLSENLRNPSWVATRLSALKQAEPDDPATEGGWFAQDIILLKNGEWMAYTNICRKEDWRINDLFLGYGSDHQWYYSTFHFCIRAFVLRMQGQFESLAAMKKDCYLQPFDGTSEKCLEKTWPLSQK